MAEAPFDVVGVGNAIVDVLAQADDDYLDRNKLDKGMMTLIDTDRARDLYQSMGPAIEVSGGSAANTLAGLTSLGGKGAYIGKVRNDQLGGVFTHDIRAAGVDFRNWPAKEGPPTARCLIFVTPDAQRTMQTYLGISVELSSDDIDPEAIGSARITYLEGYLFDRDEAKKAFVKAAEIAHAAGRKVALTLSDSFCVERHRPEFRHLVAGHVDIPSEGIGLQHRVARTQTEVSCCHAVLLVPLVFRKLPRRSGGRALFARSLSLPGVSCSMA